MTGNGILIVWTDVPAEIENDFNHWYNHEHLPDRVGRMPGFLRGRRYVAMDASADVPKFLTLYDLHEAAVMMSEAHVALRKNRSARDLYFVLQFRNTIKGICDVVYRASDGEGDHLVLLPMVAEAHREAAFAHSVCEQVLPELSAMKGVASALIALRNAAITQASSAKDDRSGDRYVDGLIAVEAASESAAIAAATTLSAAKLDRYGGRAQFFHAPCVLRLIHALGPTY